MKKTLHIFACCALAIGVWACEQPEAPNFKLNHELDAPLTVEKSYPFLGDSDALIDTTAEDYEDIFRTDSDGLVRLSKEQDFNFGDLNDAIPEVNAQSATVNSQVGPISLTNFSSGNVGSASFEQITGSPTPLQQDDPLPAGSTPGTINIDFNNDYFTSAVIKEDGLLEITVTNNLGFDIDQLNITLNSDNSTVGSTTISPFNNNDTKTATIPIPANIQATNPLEMLNVDVSANWDSQTMQEDANNLVVEDVTGINLVASQVTASVESQSFTSSGNSVIDESNFEFRDTNDFVALSSGDLSINIDNNIDLGVETLDISFPEIVDDAGNPLVLNLSNIPASSAGGSFTHTEDLSGYRIKAVNGELNYNVSATTENTQQGSGSTRTINENDNLSAEININNLQISRAEGYIVPRTVLLGDDATNDGRQNLDVFNDNEAEITTIDGISDLSDRVSEITFSNPALSMNYLTNLGVNTTIYAAIAGTDADGNTVFLTGKENTSFDVSSSEIPQELEANAQQLTEDQIIKFSLETASNPDPQQGEPGANIFDSNETNTSAFFSNLPTEIRFVGVAVVNEQQTSGTVVNPVIFDPSLSLDLPINFSANNASFKDSLDADLSELPDEQSEQDLSEATLTIHYRNGLPLDLDLSLALRDENGDTVTTKSNITINAASTNDQGFVADGGAAESEVQISFSDDELTQLYRTRTIGVDIGINTPQQRSVKIRKDDAISLKIQLDAALTSTVN